MLEQRYRWKNKQLREHVAVMDGELAPTLLLKNARYLNQTFRKWMTSHIWIYEDRIVYVGKNSHPLRRAAKLLIVQVNCWSQVIWNRIRIHI